jgi:hypothetical protein
MGGYKDGNRTEGKEYELQEDHTHTLFHVKYDNDGDEIEKEEISKGNKIV